LTAACAATSGAAPEASPDVAITAPLASVTSSRFAALNCGPYLRISFRTVAASSVVTAALSVGESAMRRAVTV
jgi:hypothetical protein